MTPPLQRILLFTLVLGGLAPRHAVAQDTPPKIGPLVVDLHGTVPRFPGGPLLAESRGLEQGELPGSGLGAHGGVHVYGVTWRAVTFGFGVDVTLARAHRASLDAPDGTPLRRATTERFRHIAPELSLNFGTGDGWSYLSGGIGPATWSIVPDDAIAGGARQERLKTINYGGGARWMLRPHLAFSLDVRLYAVDPGTPEQGRPGSPRSTFVIMGAGVSVK